MKHNDRLGCIVTLLILFGGESARAGDVTEAWVDRFNGTADMNDYSEAITIAPDGHIYLSGFTFVQVQQNLFAPVYLTIKYDDAGNRIWTRTVQTSITAAAYHNAVDPQGNINVTGSVDYEDWLTVRYAPDGQTLWTHRFDTGSSYIPRPYGMATDAQGNVFLTGDVGLFSGTAALTLRIDNDGETGWTRHWAGVSTDEAAGRAIVVADDGSVYVAGWTAVDDRAVDFAIWKYSNDGVFQWAATTGAPGRTPVDVASDVAIDAQGNIVACGYINGNSVDPPDAITVKVDPDGNILWERLYGGTGTDRATSIAVDAQNNVFVGGYSETSSGNADGLILKYAPDGTLLWDHLIAGDGADTDVVRDIAVDADGNVYACGVMRPFAQVDFYLTISLGPDGTQRWIMTYGGPRDGDSDARAIALGGDNSIYVTGDSLSDFTENDIATIKYEQPDGGGALPAMLTRISVEFGEHISGDLQSVLTSDDVRYVGRSGFGFSAIEPTLYEVVIGAETSVPAPQSFDISVEARLDHPEGLARMKVMNWSTGLFQQVHQYTLGLSEFVERVQGVDATDRVRDPGGVGEIEMMLSKSVVAVFSLSGFRSSIDHVEIMVR